MGLLSGRILVILGTECHCFVARQKSKRDYDWRRSPFAVCSMARHRANYPNSLADSLIRVSFCQPLREALLRLYRMKRNVMRTTICFGGGCCPFARETGFPLYLSTLPILGCLRHLSEICFGPSSASMISGRVFRCTGGGHE